MAKVDISQADARRAVDSKVTIAGRIVDKRLIAEQASRLLKNAKAQAIKERVAAYLAEAEKL